MSRTLCSGLVSLCPWSINIGFFELLEAADFCTGILDSKCIFMRVLADKPLEAYNTKVVWTSLYVCASSVSPFCRFISPECVDVVQQLHIARCT